MSTSSFQPLDRNTLTILSPVREPTQDTSPNNNHNYGSHTEQQNDPFTTSLDPTTVVESPSAQIIQSHTRRPRSPTTVSDQPSLSPYFGGRPECPAEHLPQESSQSTDQIVTPHSLGDNDILPCPLLNTSTSPPLPYASPTSTNFPFVINGIRTASDKRLLHHFVHILSPKLVLHSEPTQNPFNTIVLPLALYDEEGWGLFDLMLSFAASHLIRLLTKESEQHHNDEIHHFENIKWSRYGHAIKRHARNLSLVLNPGSNPPGEAHFIDDNQINYAVATTMLLCQWSTCEGGDQSPWRLHLNASRELVRRKVEGWHGNFEPLSDASQMLLEWFFLHDVISKVTFPGSSCSSDLQRGAVEASGDSAPACSLPTLFSRRPVSQLLWIGPNDGLLEILARILALRERQDPITPRNPSETSPHLQDLRVESVCGSTGGSSAGGTRDSRISIPPTIRESPRKMSNSLFGKPANKFDVNQFFEALAIEDSLREWSFNYTSSQQSAVGASYRFAEFIMLHFTVYQACPLDDPKVRSWVESLIQSLGAISETDNAQTCSLFPIFICGVTVKKPEDRTFVIEKAKAYSRWSGMGYIEDVIGFLSDWWDKQDQLDAAAAISDRSVLPSENEELHPRAPIWWAWENFMRQRELQLILV